jgi:excisionase family DNA binding protein
MTTLKISHATLYRLLAAGKITARKVGRSTIIDADSVDRFWDTLPPAKFRAPREVV